MKNYLKSMFILLFAVLFMVSCSPEKQEPQAVQGWENGQKVVQVTDDNGQQFLMNYLLFTSLMNHGGYNNVVHHYYQNPTSRDYRPVTTKFTPSTPVKAFSSSYKNVQRTNKVYKPSQYTVNKTTAVKTKLYPSAYKSKVSSYKPSTSVKVNRSSYTAPSTRSSSRSSYTPSRSTYSAPSRSSYSSPSRSYSSPSRSSYSSRSYSSSRR